MFWTATLAASSTTAVIVEELVPATDGVAALAVTLTWAAVERLQPAPVDVDWASVLPLPPQPARSRAAMGPPRD